MNKKEWGEQQIRDYLLGRLPENETEELDELSIADDEFALRRQAVENELLDAYLKGEISELDLSKFKTRYLSYPPRRKKIQIANAFHYLLEKEKGVEKPKPSPENSTFRLPAWLAAAAILLLLLIGYLAYQNMRIRNYMAQEQAELKALKARELELQKQLDDQRQTQIGEEQKPETMIAMNLLPATRGISNVPILEVPAGTDSIILTLQLETNHYPKYQVDLGDPVTHEILWRSETVKPRKTILIKVPVNLFRTQQYQFELNGIPATGEREFVAGYPITVIRK